MNLPPNRNRFSGSVLVIVFQLKELNCGSPQAGKEVASIYDLLRYLLYGLIPNLTG